MIFLLKIYQKILYNLCIRINVEWFYCWQNFCSPLLFGIESDLMKKEIVTEN